MDLVLALLAGTSLALLVFSLVSLGGGLASGSEERAPGDQGRGAPFLVRLALPFGRPVAAAVRERNRLVAARRGPEAADSPLISLQNRLLRLLIAAGRPGGLEPPEFLGLVAVGAIVGGLLGAFLPLVARWTPWPFVGPGALLGALLPVAWLSDTYKRRRQAIQRALPFALDLLTLSVEAGLDFTTAIARLVRRLGAGPLGGELGEVLRQIQMGRTRAQALRDLAWRVNQPELTSVAAALIQADELGASLSPILRLQADQQRLRRAQRAEEAAMKTPVKILFPLVVFIFPTTFLVIIGPLLVNLWPQVRLLLGAGEG